MLRLLCFICLSLNTAQALEGPNTCIQEHEVPVVVKVPAKVPQEVTTYKWCAKIIPRCKTTTIVKVDGYKEEIHYEKNRTRVCCKGYAEARNKCVPVCSSPCLHGRCISPEKCQCLPGWKGQHCEIECNGNENECNQECYCDNGSDLCPYGTYGPNCTQRCNCSSVNDPKYDSDTHILCDPIAGCKVLSSMPLEIRKVENESNDNHASATLIFLIGMIMIVLIISGFLILKYRRKLRLLNSELAFVTYISRKESNDRFDNPLYSYQATTADFKPSMPNSDSPPAPSQASSSTKSSSFSGFKRNFETNICKGAQDKSSGLPNDFLKPNLNATSCYDDLKTTKREYNSNIYEESDNCGSRSSTLTKEPVYAEIPGAESKEDLKESPYDSPRPLDPNNQVNKL